MCSEVMSHTLGIRFNNIYKPKKRRIGISAGTISLGSEIKRSNMRSLTIGIATERNIEVFTFTWMVLDHQTAAWHKLANRAHLCSG